jgi:hypothetical protein
VSRPRQPPRAVLELPLEGLPRLRIEAESYEDERRLVAWLGSASARRLIADALAQLDDLGPEAA